ncbi:MAG: hypothetical protein JRE23_12300 [Deltaproteobacteria bacterium]|nr:hypothetical protein [Deltaproteobacteria bacterium]
MVLRSIKVVLTVCIIITGLISACSDRDEKHKEERELLSKNYTKKDLNRKETLAFYDALKEISHKDHGKGSEGPEIFMHTLKPEDDKSIYYCIGECFLTVSVDVDGDKKKDEVCLRYLQYKEYDDIYIYISLIVDLFKNKKHVLRQELDREFFFDERFVGFKDIDLDEKAELITKVRFSPDCAGCGSYRIYTFNDDRFELTLNLFNIEPNNPSLKSILGNISIFEEMILKDYREKTKTEYPCGIWESCIIYSPWLVDSDHDGLPEVVLLVRSPYDSTCDRDKTHYLFLAKFTKSGKLISYNLHPIKLGYCDALVDVLGFLETKDKDIHLLVNWALGGTSTAYPLLNIFNVQWNNIIKIGKFCGFYENRISERLRDLDQDGNTEIIYVGESYVPPGGANADVIIFYDIAEYRDGRYVDANEKFKSFRDRLNQFK